MGVSPILVTFQIWPFSTSMIMGERVVLRGSYCSILAMLFVEGTSIKQLLLKDFFLKDIVLKRGFEVFCHLWNMETNSSSPFSCDNKVVMYGRDHFF